MRIEILTFLRFIASIIVVTFHYGKQLLNCDTLAIPGPEMVTFFFVLSGFVLTLRYSRNKSFSTKIYFLQRITRILPVYLLALLFTTTILYSGGEVIKLKPLLLSIFCIQSWLPPYPLSLNNVGWSISVEVFFYILFPIIIKNYNLISYKNFLLTIFTLWVVTQVLLSIILTTTYTGFPSVEHDIVYYFPPSHLCSFMLGVLGAIIFDQKKSISCNNNYILHAIIYGIIIWLIINNYVGIQDILNVKIAFASSFLSPLFMAFIVSIALSKCKLIAFLGKKFFVLLGESSYSIYILQFPVYLIYKDYFFFIQSNIINFVFYLLLLILISIACFLFFEKPISKFTKMILS